MGITECVIFLATLLPTTMSDNDVINGYLSCNDNVPKSMHQYADLYYTNFDIENIETAVKIGWCESRGKEKAYRDDNGDSGVMQFVHWTWNWVAEKYDLPIWDEWQILRYGQPYLGATSKSDIGFSFEKAQLTPYYNIMFASILAEDIYGKTQWRDWSSSEWCWSDTENWRAKWKSERY